MPSKLPPHQVRMEDALFNKIAALAEKEGRIPTQQMRYILKCYIEKYEQENGKLTED